MMHQAHRSATLTFAAAICTTVLTTVSAAATTQPAAGARAPDLASWGIAQEVPGLAALNQGGQASLGSVSCASPGNCSAGGSYQDGSGNNQAFVVSEVNGTWQNAMEVPGTATLNSGGSAGIGPVSCTSPGNCGAGGSYTDGSGNFQVFVVSEVNGTWQNAEEVPGGLNQGQFTEIASVSCTSAGNCSAGGYYMDGHNRQKAFVVSETNGTWQNAMEVPGTAALNSGGFADLESVSCTSPGNCGAGGRYRVAVSGKEQVYVVSETNGTWQKAKEVPGTATLNQGGDAFMTSVSCTSAGNCSAGGGYTDGSGHHQAFVVSETNGTWQKAKEVPGTAALNASGAAINSVSCTSAGNCGAGGFYLGAARHEQAFVASETNGTWQKARKVPGTATLNAGGAAVINRVSCASAGNCGAGGSYRDGSGHGQAFVASEINGTWQNAEEIPGTATLNQGGRATITSVSCASAGNCGAGGSYTDGSGHAQAFVVSES